MPNNKSFTNHIQEGRDLGKRVREIINKKDPVYTDDEIKDVLYYAALIGSADYGLSGRGANSVFYGFELMANSRGIST